MHYNLNNIKKLDNVMKGFDLNTSNEYNEINWSFKPLVTYNLVGTKNLFQ